MIKTDVLVIGAGPVGLFAVHQLGIIGLKAEVVDNLDKIGGQCIELYPDKPIYDIPAIPECTGESLTKSLLEQIKPFKTNFHLNERVQAVSKEKGNWKVTTSKNKIFIAPNIIIAGGGMILYELACVGTPGIVLCQTDYQRMEAKCFDK